MHGAIAVVVEFECLHVVLASSYVESLHDFKVRLDIIHSLLRC